MQNLQLSIKFTKNMNIMIYAGLEIYVVGKYAFTVLANILSLPEL